MAIFRVLKDNTAFLVKSIPPELEEEFLRLNPKGFIKVEDYPICEFETWRYNPEAGKVEIDQKRFIKKAIETYSEQLKNLEFQRLQKVLDKYGYKDLGDVQYWHSQDPKDEEPAGLLTWYKAYDDAIWNEIDSLSRKSFEELQNYNPVAVENQIFEQTKGKLPPVEG